MKHFGLILVAVIGLAGCGGGSSSEPSSNTPSYTWQKGPAPGTGSNVWVLSPGASDEEINSICEDFQTEWPAEAAGEDQITVANDTKSDTSSLVCVRVE